MLFYFNVFIYGTSLKVKNSNLLCQCLFRRGTCFGFLHGLFRRHCFGRGLVLFEFNWSEVHDVAEQLEHVKSKKLTNKLDHFLNYPKFDPHGEPIPSKNGIISPTKRVLLSEVPIKTKGIIMGVSTDESEFLDYLTQLNFKIGSKIKILDIILFDKSMKIQIGDKIEQISEEVTNNIHIKIIE